MIKNTTAQHISFVAIATADGAAVTTGTPAVYLSKDGAAQATSTNTASHLGNGVWVLDLTQAETNADHLSAVMVLATAVNSFCQAFPVVQADFKADVSSLATATVLNNIGSAVTGNASAIAVVDTVVYAIKVVTDALPNSGALSDLATAASISALNDFDPSSQSVTTDSASRTASQADVSSLATAASISALNDFDPSSQSVTTDSASRTASQADVSSLATAASISALNDFDPSSQSVTTDAASRDASKADVAAISTAVTAVKVKTDQMVFSNANELDVNAVTGGGGDDSATIYSYFTASSRQDVFKASGFSTFDATSDLVTTDSASRNASKADVSSVSSDVTAIKTKTDQMVFSNSNELDVNAVTGGGGDDAATIYTYFTASSREDSFKADVSGLLTSSAYSSSLPTNFIDLDIEVTSGKVTTSNPASGAGSSHTPADVAALILDNPANKLATDSSGNVEANNMRGTDGANTVAPVDVSSDVTAIKTKTDQMVFSNTNELDVNAVTGGGGDDAATIFGYFTAFSREDLFKADVSGMSTTVSSIDSKVDTLDSKINTIDNVVDAVLTDSSTLANIESKIDTVDTVVDSILLDTSEISTVDGNVNTIQSAVSSIPATLQTIEGKIDTVDTVVDSILLDTAEISTVDVNVNTIQSAVSSVPATLQTIEGKIDTIDTVVDSILLDTATIDIVHSKINTIDNVVDAVLADSSTLATIESKIDIVDTVVDSIKLDTDDLDSKLNTIDNVVDAVLVDTSELQQNQSNAATASNIYQYFTDLSRADVFKSDVSDLSVIRNKTDKMVFSGDNQLYVSVASGGGDSAETIYNYFTEGVREDQFKDGDAYGAGAVSHTVTITSDGTAVSGAEVWVSQDVTGVSIVAGTLHTNTAGQVTFMLDPGSYYLWASKSGVQFSNPQVFTVS